MVVSTLTHSLHDRGLYYKHQHFLLSTVLYRRFCLLSFGRKQVRCSDGIYLIDPDGNWFGKYYVGEKHTDPNSTKQKLVVFLACNQKKAMPV